MNTLKVRNIVLGEGIPKICVPIIGKSQEEIKREAQVLKQLPSADLAEWRADWFEGIGDLGKVRETARMLRGILGEMPILFTFRSLKEGGERDISKEDYVTLLKEIIRDRNMDLVDVELFMGDEIVADFVHTAHQAGISVIASNHEFGCTPEKKELIHRLCKMQELGADALKIAVMPADNQDVLTLLRAASEMKDCFAKRPLITMSMGGIGVISRLAGEVFGSALTFGSVEKASAPGQIHAEELKAVLKIVHRSIKE